MANSAFSPSVLTLPSTGGTGQGELNLVLNSVGAANEDGWVGATRQSGGGPLNPTVGTYFTLTAANSASENYTSGSYYSFTLPSGLQNRKLKVEFYYTSVATDVVKVSVYKGTTRVPLSTDSSGSTTLPASTTGKFTAYFDTDSSGSWSINITRTSGSGSALQFTQVVVGPGIQPQGAVVSGANSFTPTFIASALTLAASTAYYWREGDSMRVQGTVTSGTVTGSNANLNLPLGTVDTSHASGQVVGRWIRSSSNASSRKGGDIFAVGNGTNQFVYFSSDDTAAAVSPFSAVAANALFVSGDVISFEFKVKIAEWAGSGTVQLAQNDVEYAYNTGTWDAPDSTSFGYGPSGQVIPQSTDLTDLRKKRVRFQTPIQPGDSIVVEFQVNGTWVPAVGVAGNGDWSLDLFSYATSSASTSSRGIGWKPVSGSTTDIDVYFGRYASFYNNATGIGWSTYIFTTTVRWRVRKSSAGAAVGFGIHQPGVSSGLVSASGLVGRTDGLAVPSGYVGELTSSVVGNNISVGTASYTTSAPLVLGAGNWNVFLQATSAGNISVVGLEIGISTDSGSTTFTDRDLTSNVLKLGVGAGFGAGGQLWVQYNTTGTTLYAKLKASGAAESTYYRLRAVRIA